MKSPRETRLRAWPAVVVVAVGTAALAWIWFDAEIPRQERNIRAAITVSIMAALLLAWFLFLSRARWRSRAAVVVLLALAVVTATQFFVLRGVTGDLVPIIEFKSTKPKGPNQPAAPPSAAREALKGVPGEFPGFMGKDRTGVIDGIALATNWIEHPPQLLWKQPVGAAWSGFAARDGIAVTQEQRGESEFVVAYELLTGKTIWSHEDKARYSTIIAGEGPRATPTIEGDRVFTFGATGILNCLDLLTGAVIWSKDTLQENKASLPDWGLASSPLVVDGKVVVSVGGATDRSLVAYSIENGEIEWAEGSGGADYSSPIQVELLGSPQILIFNTEGLVSHALEGKILWKHPWRGGHRHISLPVVVSSNQVLVSSGYGTGAELLEVSHAEGGDWKVERVWKSIALKSKFGPIFVHEEHIYGLDDGIFTCVDLKTGQRQWKDGRYGHGQGLMVGGLILLTSEKGELVLIQPDPNKLLEISRLPVMEGKTWNPPALVGDYLLVRNHEEAACLQLQRRPERQRIVALLFAKPIFHQ